MNYFQESYPETSSTHHHNSYYSTSSLAQTTPPLSSTPTSSTITPICVPPLRPKKNLNMTAQEFVPTTPPGFKQQQQQGSFYQGNECGFAGGMNRQYGGYIGGVPMPINCSLLNNAAAHNHLLLRQQQILQEKHHLLQKQQQELAAATIAKQQFVLSAAAVANHPQDEISNSLKMFAVLSACKGNETPPSSEEVMQDFATNGYTTDELHRYQQYQAVSNMQIYGNSSPFPNDRRFNYYDSNRNLNNNNNMNWLYNQQQLFHENINAYNDLWRQNFLSMLPAQLIQQAERAAAMTAAAAAVNMDFNNQNGRPHKRPQFKKDAQVAIRRCVFCENNNEPEAVVKSHAVRDSQGRVLCPKLRIYVCPICGASGDDAHTVKYCPQKPIITMEDATKSEPIRYSKAKTSQMSV